MKPNKITIGCDASRLHVKEKTGVEEYATQILTRLPSLAPEIEFRFYAWKKSDHTLPNNVQWIILPKKKFWTQRVLSRELSKHPTDAYFSPVYTLPRRHPDVSIVTIHGLEFLTTKESYSRWHRLYHRLLTRYSLSQATQIITVSENTKTDIKVFYPQATVKIAVVPNGINHRNLEHKPIQPPNILFVGRLERRKNVANIIRAFTILKKTTPTATLTLAGKWGEGGTEEIQRELHESRYADDITVPGYITESQKQQYLQQATLFVFPSLYEGFGIPVLEAMDAGLPVVTSENGSLSEVAGKAAVYANPAQPRSIARAMRKILESEQLQDQLSTEGRRRAQQFSWDKAAQQTLGVLLDALTRE